MMSSRNVTCLAFALTLTLGFGSAHAGDPASVIPLEQAVLEFNAEWESARREIEERRLTPEEVVAAIRHDAPKMSDQARSIALQIAQTQALPSGTKISLRRRHFSNQTMSYVWNITLVIDKTWDDATNTGAVPEAKSTQRGTPVETLLVRKRYLASQPTRAGQELKPLEELLARSDR